MQNIFSKKGLQNLVQDAKAHIRAHGAYLEVSEYVRMRADKVLCKLCKS